MDTNILLYAHRSESPWHEAAATCLRRVALGRWAIPWPCVHEFIAIATHPRVFDPPSPMDDARGAWASWRSVPTTIFLAETEGYDDVLADLLRTSGVVGPRIHDARIAALCPLHGVQEQWTADRDFSRFPALVTRNPLIWTGLSRVRVLLDVLRQPSCRRRRDETHPFGWRRPHPRDDIRATRRLCQVLNASSDAPAGPSPGWHGSPRTGGAFPGATGRADAAFIRGMPEKPTHRGSCETRPALL